MSRLRFGKRKSNIKSQLQSLSITSVTPRLFCNNTNFLLLLFTLCCRLSLLLLCAYSSEYSFIIVHLNSNVVRTLFLTFFVLVFVFFLHEFKPQTVQKITYYPTSKTYLSTTFIYSTALLNLLNSPQLNLLMQTVTIMDSTFVHKNTSDYLIYSRQAHYLLLLHHQFEHHTTATLIAQRLLLTHRTKRLLSSLLILFLDKSHSQHIICPTISSSTFL